MLFVIKWISASLRELRHMTWPRYEEVRRLVLLLLVGLAVVVLVLFGVDQMLKVAQKWLYGWVDNPVN